MQNPRHLPKISRLRLALYKQTTFGKFCVIMTSWRSTGGARTPTNTVITKLILHFASTMPGNYRFISAEQKRLVLTMSLRGMMVRDIVSATDEVEDGGAIRTESRGLDRKSVV